MEKVFLNFTNHGSDTWEERQLEEARKYGEIVDLPFPNVDPCAREKDIEALGEECCREILRRRPAAVLCQGEFSLTFFVVTRLRAHGVKVLTACSERKVVQKGNVKSSIFEFAGFREYVYREQEEGKRASVSRMPSDVLAGAAKRRVPKP